jgi:hypothetical protein
LREAQFGVVSNFESAGHTAIAVQSTKRQMAPTSNAEQTFSVTSFTYATLSGWKSALDSIFEYMSAGICSRELKMWEFRMSRQTTTRQTVCQTLVLLLFSQIPEIVSCEKGFKRCLPFHYVTTTHRTYVCTYIFWDVFQTLEGDQQVS